MKHEQLLAILNDIKILDRLFIATPSSGGWHLQVTYNEADIDTGKIEQQYSRKWFVADDATESDVVDTAFACVMRSYDHVVQEHFTYKGKRVFSPHYTIEQRLAMASRQEAEARKERCVCGHDFEFRDENYRNMHKSNCAVELAARQRREDAHAKQVEEVVGTFERWLQRGMYGQVDDLLMLMKIEDSPPAVLLGVLSITFHDKAQLKRREDFLRRAEAKLRAELGDTRAEDLLRNRR